MTIARGGHHEAILEAASLQFLSLGYTKTTTDDIARACHISPAHLYNHFRSKLDLAISVVEREEKAIAAELKAVLMNDGAVEQVLEAYFLTELSLRVGKIREYPGYPNLLSLVEERRAVVAEGFRLRLLKDLSLYLNKAMGRGELDMVDSFWLAEMLQLATYPFRHQSFIVKRNENDMARDILQVVGLILKGAGKKGPSAGRAEGQV